MTPKPLAQPLILIAASELTELGIALAKTNGNMKLESATLNGYCRILYDYIHCGSAFFVDCRMPKRFQQHTGTYSGPNIIFAT